MKEREEEFACKRVTNVCAAGHLCTQEVKCRLCCCPSTALAGVRQAATMQHVAAANAVGQREANRAMGRVPCDGSERHTTRPSTVRSSTISLRGSALESGGCSMANLAALAVAEKKRGNQRVGAHLNQTAQTAAIAEVKQKQNLRQKLSGSFKNLSPIGKSKKVEKVGDDEDEDEEKPPRCIIMPDGNFRARPPPAPRPRAAGPLRRAVVPPSAPQPSA